MTPILLSLYIHIPWCVRKCPYCDFNSHQTPHDNNGNQSVPEKDYIRALLNDLETELPHIWGRPLESIFIGGGTPSLFSAEGIDALLSGLRERLPIRPTMEVTLEANPGTFEQERFSQYRQAGINRLSIGIQSYNSEHLKLLGRIHDGNEALNAASIAKKAGFDNFNLDLMHGLPKQNCEQALADLQQAIDCEPSHISWYQLTIEKNTLFHHSPPVLPNDDALWEIQQQGQSLLKKAGYSQYEVSAYAKGADGKNNCNHNMNYWQFGDYVGIGAGAHGKITQPDGTITRHTKYRQPAEYINQASKREPRSSTTLLTKKELPFEFMLNALRLKQGFSSDLFEQRTRLNFSEVEPMIQQAIEKQLMIKDENKREHFRTSKKGWEFLNDVMEMFL